MVTCNKEEVAYNQEHRSASWKQYSLDKQLLVMCKQSSLSLQNWADADDTGI
jgi:hypothetical protein